MFNQMLTEKIQRSDYFCTIVCTELTHTSPNTVISPADRDSILLKIRGTQNVNRSTNQKVGGSTPLGRATLFDNLSTCLKISGSGHTPFCRPRWPPSQLIHASETGTCVSSVCD
jgi:hypothetical protein